MPVTTPGAPPPSTTDAPVASLIPSGGDWQLIAPLQAVSVPEDTSAIGVDMTDHQMSPYGQTQFLDYLLANLQEKAAEQGKTLYGVWIWGSPTQIKSSQGQGGYRFVVVTTR